MGLVSQPSVELPLLGAYEVTYSANRFLKHCGPGLLMSIAYVDPGNLESDLQVGANAGYALLWVLLWCTALGYIVQMQAAKLGVVTGKHLAEHCREQFSPALRYFLWVMAEIAIIGSDIQEVIGSAIALLLLSHGAVPLWAGVLLSVGLSFIMLLVERCGVAPLEALFGVLISVMVGSFAVMFVRADVPLDAVAAGFVTPKVPRANIGQAVALVGSMLMPHNLFLHSALVHSRPLRRQDDHHKQEALVYYSIESGLSLLISVFINTFVTGVFAAGFYGQALQDIGLENAGQYLGRTYGQPIVYIWALGLLAAGQSSTMTGTYTGQFVMQGYLNMRVAPWLRVLITRSVALVPALVVSLMTRTNNHSTALDQLNQWLNLLQSVQLPFALIPVLAFNASVPLMGKFANGRGMVGLTVAISLLVMLVNVSGVLAFVEAALAGAGTGDTTWLLVGACVAGYLGIVSYVFLHACAAAGLLPPVLGFVAPGGAPGGGGGAAGGVGGGMFARVPRSGGGGEDSGGGGDSDSEPGDGGGVDEEAGPEPRLAAGGAAAAAPGAELEAAAGAGGAWLPAPSSRGSTQQQLQEPLLPPSRVLPA